jgi:hypothetical protein
MQLTTQTIKSTDYEKSVQGMFWNKLSPEKRKKFLQNIYLSDRVVDKFINMSYKELPTRVHSTLIQEILEFLETHI